MGHSDRQATKKTPKNKFTSVSPCFRVQMGNSDRQATRKTPPQKMSIVLPLLQGNNRRNLSHVRRTLVWGAKFTKKSTETELAQPHLLQRGVELNAKRW